jgi:hypothetical protein
MDEDKIDIEPIDRGSQVRELIDSTTGNSLEDQYLRILNKSPNRGCGKFQYIVFVTFIVANMCWGFIFYALAFIELMPELTNCIIDG